MKTTKFDFNGRKVTVGELRKFDGIPLLEIPALIKGVNTENGTNFRLIDPLVADFLLNMTKAGNKYLDDIGDAFPSPVNLGIGYEKPGVKLSAEIVFSAEGEPKVLLPTGRYNGEKGIALVVPELTADDIKREGNEIIIDVPDSRLVVVPNFPTENGWYIPYAETGIPHGEKVEASDEARFIFRLSGSSYVGLPVRGYGRVFGGYDMQDVGADCKPSYYLGVAVEIPEEGAQTRIKKSTEI
jgi:hypothetical protein